MNMKKVIGLFFLSLIGVVALVACGDDAADINTCKYANVPASLISDPTKLKMLHSIQDLDDGRFFYLDYTADYKLDKSIVNTVL